jgi:hypothetical protein
MASFIEIGASWPSPWINLNIFSALQNLRLACVLRKVIRRPPDMYSRQVHNPTNGIAVQTRNATVSKCIDIPRLE